MEDERSGVADVSEQRENCDALSDLDPSLIPALHPESKDGAGALGQVSLGQSMVFVARQPGVCRTADDQTTEPCTSGSKSCQNLMRW